jgi:hypothetical protein
MTSAVLLDLQALLDRLILAGVSGLDATRLATRLRDARFAATNLERSRTTLLALDCLIRDARIDIVGAEVLAESAPSARAEVRRLRHVLAAVRAERAALGPAGRHADEGDGEL